MRSLATEQRMAAKKRQDRAKRNDMTVKIDAEIINQAKYVILPRGITLAEYLSEMLRGPVKRDYDKEMKRLTKGGGEE